MSVAAGGYSSMLAGASASDKGKRRNRRKELSEEQKQEVRDAFELFDTDKDQAIDYHELKVSKPACTCKSTLSSLTVSLFCKVMLT